jgi:hypothetical protein
MSDENQQPDTAEDTSTSYRYYNLNNGDVVERDQPQSRFEALQNWVTVESDEHLDELRQDNDRNGRGNLLGSSSVGDRVEPRHQVPSSTFVPEVEYTEPSTNELRGNAPDAEDYHLDKQPQVITVDPSKQVQPIAGEGKRDLSAVVLDENIDTTPGVRHALGSGSPDGVLARAHPELEGVEERREQIAQERKDARETGDPDAGHLAVRSRPATGDEASTDGGKQDGTTTATGREPATSDRPSNSAPKAKWVDYAVVQGADRTEASNMTKADLVEVYGDGE